MKHKKQLLCILVLVWVYAINAQSYAIPKSPLLNYLYHTKASIKEVTNKDARQIFIPLSDPRLVNHLQKIIKNKSGFYILIDQTGRVYKATGETTDKIIFTRQDSTFYWGYNGGSIDFSYNDTIFSFGGSGFWKLNGQLRFYSKVFNEWNIIPISEEYPTIDFVNFLSSKNDQLYYFQKPYENPATSKQLSGWFLMKLNMRNKENQQLGTISPSLLENLMTYENNLNINLPSLDGKLVVFSYDKMLLIRFNENAIYKLTNQSIKDLLLGNSAANKIRNSFEVGDSVYYTLSNDSSNQLYSFKITIKDFTKEKISIYKEQQSNWIFILQIALIIMLISTLLFWIVFKTKKNTFRKNALNTIYTNLETENEFTQIEHDLIVQIIKCVEKGTYISTDQINNTLGVIKKSIETQKKVRGDTINRINYKFKTWFEQDVDFIERLRSESDRRFYNYIISKENAALYKERMKKKL